MKYLKIVFVCFLFMVLSNCTTSFKRSSNNFPDFKIGKKGFENLIAKEFNFEKLTLGTYEKGSSNTVSEKGANLTFLGVDEMLEESSDSTLVKNARFIRNLTVKNLLNLEKFDFVVITFENEDEKGVLTTITKKRIKLEL
ncbi:hypothetical protein [Polaribacter aestuariivivens]|uniref:hypothetical protein n=1 Tax=Polaribacter aestuariivivens TaxID=2304626 RepID=UPI003F4940E5